MSWSSFPPPHIIPLGNYRSQVPYPVSGMGLWESFRSKPEPDQTQPGVVTPIGLRYWRMDRHQWVASQPTALRLVVKQADRVRGSSCQHRKPLDNFVEGTFTRASGGPVTGHECQTLVMGWHSPARGHVYERCAAISTARRPVCLSPRRKTEESRDVPHLYSLGSAYAGPGCREFRPEAPGRQLSESLREPSTTAAPVDSIVHVPAEIRQMMAQVARANGRSERDLWTEAADAWLASHTNDDDPVPPAPSAALALPVVSRSWDMIDDLLSALRRPAGGSGTHEKERAA